VCSFRGVDIKIANPLGLLQEFQVPAVEPHPNMMGTNVLES
jgi:hypothetical protein